MEVLKFFTDTCVPCKKVTNLLETKFPDLHVVPIDALEEPEMAEKYDVIATPTLVFVENGREKARLLGLVKESEIQEVLEKAKAL